MEQKNFEAFIGKQVEIFLVPDTPKTSGVLLRCEDDHIVIGEEIWAYPAVLGIRPLKKSAKNTRLRQLIIQEAHAQPEIKEEIKTEPAVLEEIITVQEEEKEKEQKHTKTQEKEKKQEKSSEPAQEKISEPEKKAEVEAKAETEAEPEPQEKKTDLDPGHEFEGKLVSFYYERGYWGFIESEEVRKYNIPLHDGERIFVHINQITDQVLKNKLMQEKNPKPMIDVIFKLGKNKHGAVADDVRDKANVNLPKLPESVLKVDMLSAIYEEGEIEFFRRYEEVPYGEIRVKGNKLYRFEDTDVVDPILAVFLECSPSAEGLKVRFIKTMGARGKMKATQISASEPFPDEKLKDWEKSGLIQKAKERMGIKE